MKRLLIIAIVLAGAVAAQAGDLNMMAYVYDTSPTNLRETPGGKVAYVLPTECHYVLTLDEVRNGWWSICWVNEVETDVAPRLFGSSTGRYWIHYSVLGLETRNYGGRALQLRAKPSKSAKAVTTLRSSQVVHPMDRSGEWVKVKTLSGKVGWLPEWELCDNPLTTCP